MKVKSEKKTKNFKIKFGSLEINFTFATAYRDRETSK